MSRTAHTIALFFAVIAALFLAWSIAAPWGAAARGTTDRYKVSLFGVWHIIPAASGRSDQVRCLWSDREPTSACRPAPKGHGRFVRVGLARWFVIGAAVLLCVGLIGLGRNRVRLGGICCAIGGVATITAVLLIRTSVAGALAVLADVPITTDGSGYNAAQVASSLMVFAAALFLSPQPPEPRQARIYRRRPQPPSAPTRS